MKRIFILAAFALVACGRQDPVDAAVKLPATAASPKTRAFEEAHRGLYCDSAAAVKSDIEKKGWVYERDDDGPADSTRVFYRRKGTTLAVDYNANNSKACIVGKSHDI